MKSVGKSLNTYISSSTNDVNRALSGTAKMTGIEVFAGVGGLSLGASMAGVDVKLAVEIDSFAAQTFKANHKGTLVINDDIRKVKSIPVKKDKRPTVCMGGAPCQGFSFSNQKTRNLENENNWLFEEFVRVAKLYKSDWIVFENVSGLVHTENGYFLEQILKKLKKIGYHTQFQLLNSSQFGVPQKRERLFIVGSLDNISFKFPKPKKTTITVSDAIGDLPRLTNGDMISELDYKKDAHSDFAKLMRKGSKKSINNFVTRNSDLVLKRYAHIPQGGNWENIPLRLMSNYADHTRCHTGIYHRLKASEPSVVIGNYRKNMLIHPSQDRGLSVREAARLQSFPDWFDFKGTLTYQQQQVGNAVPPLLAKAVLAELINQAT